ncbi:MAG: hypothetical protein D6799_01430 [Bacteroidetes bacterium]|nr:MAG: hypothetical protein D6799_01430 [Bacteroidota bacterium]
MKKTAFAILVLSGIFASIYDKDKDPLHKRMFNITITEIKSGTPSNKSTTDELEFKNNKLFSKFLNEKFNINWISYTITKDTTYLDSVTEADVRYFEVKGLYKDEDQQETHVLCKIENELINGNIKIMKNDKLKKEFEFSGQEKATKINDKKK